MKTNKLFVFISLFIIVVACDSSRVFEENISFNNEVWHKDSTLVFEVDIVDSLAVYNVYLNNRISGQFAYSNLYLFVDTELPYNKHMRDTLECVLADPSGKWLGKGFGNIWSNRIAYRRNIRFPYAGKYTFTIEQAMRDTSLKHIVDAGLRIEKAKF
ncbi:MAG: gliding motility lipoprotein GldH [Salinivirgaceae bacterium]|nr:gliding motility lipoprotein GldH [Salinivirgaceae bacterium]